MKNSVKQEIKEIIKHYNLNCSIREFKDKVHWAIISYHQTLSESFIREFKDLVIWKYISWHQQLSESFIREFRNKLDIEELIERELITQKKLDYLEFKEKEKEFNSREKVSRFSIMEI